MPFIERSVEPKYVSRRRRCADDLDAVTNDTLVSAMKQLASLVSFADEIFHELTLQVTNVQVRSENLKNRIRRIDDAVSKLNAKQVVVPVGDLKSFGRVRDHFAAHRPTDKNLFTVATRPDTVRRLYASAFVSPVCVMRQIDDYRNDGCRSSKFFLCLPFFKDARVSFDVEIEMRRPASYCGARDWLSDDDDQVPYLALPEVPKTVELDGAVVQSSPEVSLDDDDILRRLPSPEEKTYVMSLKFPYSDVPIDVTGSGFRRMASLRRSFLQQLEQLSRRKKKREKRRNTVTGADNKRDVDEALRKNNGTQTSPPEWSLSDNDEERQSPPRVVVTFERDSSSDGSSSKDKLNGSPRRKSRQPSSKTDDPQTSKLEKDAASLTLPLPGLKWFQRKGRNRNSIIGSLGIYEELERVKKSRRGIFGSLRSSSSIPERVSGGSCSSSPSKSSTDSAIATVTSCSRNSAGRHGTVRSGHRSSLPISVHSQAMSVAVKMRENSARGNSKGREDGGQSSSGNWSASSSTRTSMESEDQQTHSTASPDLLNRTGSQTSLSKDSALSDRTTPNDEFRWHDGNPGYHSDASAGTSSSAKKFHQLTRRSVTKDTARWLRSLDEEGPNGRQTNGETSSSGTITPRVHRRTASPMDVLPLAFIDDGESSEFSVDTDGYYTSMHTDSGLRPLPSSRKQQDEGSTLSKLSDLHECGGSSTTISSMGSKDGSSEETSSKNGNGNTDGTTASSLETDSSAAETKKKIPPPPPPRSSTLTIPKGPDGVVILGGPLCGAGVSAFEREGSPASTMSSSSSSADDDRGLRLRKESTSSAKSDSEPEHVERFKLKTSINAGRIPSMCVVTPSPSDDEEAALMVDDKEACVPESTFRSIRDAKLPEKLPPVPEEMSSASSSRRSSYSSLPRASTTELHENGGGSFEAVNSNPCRTLPRCFERSTSFVGQPPSQLFMNSWPRRPTNQLVYKPETIAVGSSARRSPSEAQPTTTNAMMTFFQPPLVSGGGSQRRPHSIAVPPSYSVGEVRRNSSTSQLQSRGVPRGPLAASFAASGLRQGARVTLDPSGQVIHSTSSASPRSGPSQKNGTPESSSSPGLEEPQTKVPAAMALITTRKYDNNTIPRWKSPCGSTTASEPTSTVPRRWNQFFQRRDSPQPLATTPSPPEPLSSNKTGAYVRLDGHPTHLEPGIAAAAQQDDDRISAEKVRNLVGQRPGPPPTHVPVTSPTKANQATPLPPYYRPVTRSPQGHAGKSSPSRLPVSAGTQQTPSGIPILTATNPSPTGRSPSVGSRIQCRSPVTPPPYHWQGQRTTPPNYRQLPPPRPVSVPARQQPRPPGGPSLSPAVPVPSLLHQCVAAVPLTTGVRRAHIPKGDPNCSGLPDLHDVVSHGTPPAPPPYTSTSSPGPPTVVGRPESEVTKAKPTMTTDDLYALIHRSKKKHNIKTEPERSTSPALSSRSDSPGALTGYLSPRSRSPLCLPGDRRSWAGDQFSSASPSGAAAGDRRSWASDRLGASRPTSMHDFKMLLLQAGRNTPKDVVASRRSAAELLGACPSAKTFGGGSENSSGTTTPVVVVSPLPSLQPSSPRRSPSDSSSAGPPRVSLFGGRRRGLGRSPRVNSCAASVLHSRTDIMSTPIFEDDGSEESSDEVTPPLLNSQLVRKEIVAAT